MYAKFSWIEKVLEKNCPHRASGDLRPEYQHLQELFRETAVVALFLRRQASLLINVYLNEDDALLPTQNLQSFFEYDQGLFQANFHPHQYEMTAEKRALKVVYDRVFAAHFATSDTPNSIEKPPCCSSQIKAFNARKFITNFKLQKHTHSYKFQCDTIKAPVLPHLPAELETKLKHGCAKKFTFVLFRKINQFVFVSNVERYRSAVNSNAGILTDLLWDEAVSSIAEANQVGPQQEILQDVVIDEDDQQEGEEQEEVVDSLEINDDESANDESDDVE